MRSDIIGQVEQLSNNAVYYTDDLFNHPHDHAKSSIVGSQKRTQYFSIMGGNIFGMASHTNKTDGRYVKALQKGFRLIEELGQRGQAGVSELAAALDMPTSTVHIYLQTLRDIGYVINKNNNYQLSLRFLEIGSKVRDQKKVFAVARREMMDLCRMTGQTIGLGVFENGQRVQLWQIEGANAVNDNIHIGEYTKLHWTSLGKTLLASRTDKSIDRIIDEHGLPRATEKTITDKSDLFNEIERIRERGYTVEDEERKVGIRSVSVPVTDSAENTIAAMGIVAPKNTLTSTQCSEYVEQLKNKANIISVKYAYE